MTKVSAEPWGWDLNYPSFAVAVEDGQEINTSFFKTVTNVGLPNSTYHVRIEKPDFFDIKAQPSVLLFNVVGEKKSFIVKANGPKISQVPILSASVYLGRWSSCGVVTTRDLHCAGRNVSKQQ